MVAYLKIYIWTCSENMDKKQVLIQAFVNLL